jgi:vacuolar-type H+-ATPase subunit E/Vma4
MNVDAARAALLADAQADAQELLARADQEAAEQLAHAREQAASLLDTARADGAREATDRLVRERAGTRREARQRVLAARKAALDELCVRARDAVRALADEDDYPELIERLRLLATAQLGSDAAITVDPDGEPGVVASDGRRRVDYRLVTLADRAIEALGPEAGTLWT